MSVLLIEPDVDCADALQALLGSLDGVGAVWVAESPRAALQALDRDALHPAAVLLATHAAKESLVPTIDALRQRLRSAAIVVLSVYPDRVHPAVTARADCCISKDTDRRELQALLDNLTGHPLAAD